MLKTSTSLTSTRIVVTSHNLWCVSVWTLNLPELLSLVALLFLHLMLRSRNLSLKRIDVLTITYPLRMLFWLLLVLQRLLLIDLVVIASSIKSQVMTSLSVIVSKGLTKRNWISLVVSSSDLSAPVDDPMVTVSQLETLFHPSTALSVTLGNKSFFILYICSLSLHKRW